MEWVRESHLRPITRCFLQRFYLRASIVAVLVSFAALSLGCPIVWAQGTEIPFQLEDNLIRVPVIINGSKVDAVLDSGTGSFGLDRAFASSLGLRSGAKSGDIPGGGAAVPMFPVDLAHVDFGPERLSHIAGTAFDMGSLTASAGFPVKALLGQPVFLPQPISIDYPGRKILFLPAGTNLSCADPIPFELVGGVPVIAVSLQATPTSKARTLHLFVDLGTRHYAALLGGPFLDTATGKNLDEKGKPTQVGTGTGGTISGTVVKVSSLTVGGHDFSNLEIALTRQVGAFSMGIADGALGVPLWEEGTISFDYPHRQICLNLPKAMASR